MAPQLGVRAHDLPPRWNGRAVFWSPWTRLNGVFPFPAPHSRRCQRCGDTRPAMISVGRIWDDSSTAPIRRRSWWPWPRRAPVGQRRLLATITTFRCPGCQLDSVLDDDATLWILDPPDYTDFGAQE